MTEVWRAVSGYEGIYEVSSFGRVKSLRREVKTRVGKTRTISECFLVTKAVSPTISLAKNGCYQTCKLKRLVGNAFIPNPLNRPFLVEIDGNSRNCRVDNLEWRGDPVASRAKNKKFKMPSEDLARSISNLVAGWAKKHDHDPREVWEKLRCGDWTRLSRK